MVSQTNLVFSKSAASRILCIPKDWIAGFKIFYRVCWIWIRGSRPRFISKKIFLRHFAEYRQQQGRQLTAKSWPEVLGSFTVENPAKGSSYPVTLDSNGPACDCEDYSNQIKHLGKGVCKHGYAVLLSLGYGSLREYLAA